MNAKKKGNRGENVFAQWLRDSGITAHRNSGSGAGIEKSDVHNSLGINFEVKTVKRINIAAAWNQSRRDAEVSHAIPMLAIHLDGMPERQWLMVLHSEDWLDLLHSKAKALGITVKTESHKEKYKIQRAICALKEVEKLYA